MTSLSKKCSLRLLNKYCLFANLNPQKIHSLIIQRIICLLKLYLIQTIISWLSRGNNWTFYSVSINEATRSYYHTRIKFISDSKVHENININLSTVTTSTVSQMLIKTTADPEHSFKGLRMTPEPG